MADSDLHVPAAAPRPAGSAPAAAPATPGLLSRRPRGRPRGAKTRVLRHAGALGVHHFAFLRSWFLRLDLREAWQRYMAFAELSADLRHIEHRRSALLQQVLDAGHQLNLGLPPERQLGQALAWLSRAPQGGPSPALPTLEQFIDAQGLDREFHSEADLLLEYRHFYQLDVPPDDAAGADHTDAGHTSQAQVRALNQLEAVLARAPQADDRLALWLSPALAKLLQPAGLLTLADLADAVRVHGPRWHRRTPGLGAARARSLVDWLAPVAQQFGQALPPSAQAAALARATHPPQPMAPRFGLVPLERLVVPASLAMGRGPSAGPSPFADDLQALQAWLARHAQSPATHRAYAKEAERFYLWCLLALGKPLASVDAADCRAYGLFLAQPPADWVRPGPTARADPAWRPFRGPLSARSQQHALAVVQRLFDGLCQVQHLSVNPMRLAGPLATTAAATASAGISAARGTTPQRAFSADEWTCLLALARQEAEAGAMAGAEACRLELLLRLLAATGLRLGELAQATLDDVQQAAIGSPQAGPGATLRVRGASGGQRQLHLDAALLELLQRHHRQAAALGALPCPAPLICTLGATPGSPRGAGTSGPAPQARDKPAVRALGASGIYRTLKRFFLRASAQASAVDGLSRARLAGASAQWLRHTFGHRSAEAGLSAQALQTAFGHRSMSSTSVYLKTGSGEAGGA